MEYQRLVEFIALADTRDYGETAKKCGIHKSVLSRHIRDLEIELGVTLLDRTTHHVELNDFGTLFLPYAHRILEAEKLCRSAMSSRGEDSGNTLRIGTNLGSTSAILTLLTQREDVQLAVSADGTEDLLKSLRQNECDICLVRKKGSNVYPDMVELPYCWWEFAAIVPKDHHLAERESIALEELKNEKLYLLQANYDYVISLFRDLEIDVNIKCTSCDADFVYRSVVLGDGVSIMLKNPTKARNASGDAVILDFVPSLMCCDEIMYLKENQKLEVAEFVQFLQTGDPTAF